MTDSDSKSDDKISKEMKSSPLITNIQWGSVNVDGFNNSFKDVKLYPGDAKEWDWRVSNTHHSPGILPQDVDELISNGCSIIILSCGMRNMLKTSDATLKLLEEHQMKVNEDYFILESSSAVELYNSFAKDKKQVGALIHSTC